MIVNWVWKMVKMKKKNQHGMSHLKCNPWKRVWPWCLWFLLMCVHSFDPFQFMKPIEKLAMVSTMVCGVLGGTKIIHNHAQGMIK